MLDIPSKRQRSRALTSMCNRAFRSVAISPFALTIGSLILFGFFFCALAIEPAKALGGSMDEAGSSDESELHCDRSNSQSSGQSGNPSIVEKPQPYTRFSNGDLLYPELEDWRALRRDDPRFKSWQRSERQYFLERVVCQDQYRKFASPFFESLGREAKSLRAQNMTSQDVSIYETEDVSVTLSKSGARLLLTEISKRSATQRQFEVDEVFGNGHQQNPYVFFRDGESVYYLLADASAKESRDAKFAIPQIKRNAANKFLFSVELIETDDGSFLFARTNEGDPSGQRWDVGHTSLLCMIGRSRSSKLSCLDNVIKVERFGRHLWMSYFNESFVMPSSVNWQRSIVNEKGLSLEQVPLRDESFRIKWAVAGESEMLVAYPLKGKKSYQIFLFEFPEHKWTPLTVPLLSLDDVNSETFEMQSLPQAASNRFRVKIGLEDEVLVLDRNKKELRIESKARGRNSETTVREVNTTFNGRNLRFRLKYRKNIDLVSGKNPVLIKGYGGFGRGYFISTSKLDEYLIQRGYVFVSAALSGDDGLLPPPVYRGNKMGNRETVEDIRAISLWLISQRMTAPKKIAFMGHSNGGTVALLAAMDLSEILGAAVAEAPLTDTYRYFPVVQQRRSNADESYWYKVFGPWPDSRENSPVYKLGSKLAPVLIYHGDGDETVDAFHGYKMINRIRHLLPSAEAYLFNPGIGTAHSKGVSEFELSDSGQVPLSYVYSFIAQKLESK